MELRRHSNNFALLRLLLASSVVVAHSFDLSAGNDLAEPLRAAAHAQVKLGSLAVDGFFIISGFLIAQSWFQTASLPRYLWKRVLRIVPGYLTAVLVCLLVVQPAVSGLAGPDLRGLLGNVVVYASLLPIAGHTKLPLPYLDGVLWTIPIEFGCYLLLAALGVVGALRLRVAMLGLFVASLTLSVLMASANILSDDSWIRFLPYFLAGTTAYLYRERVTLRWPFAALAVVSVLAGFQLRPGVALVLPLAGTYLLLFAAFKVRLPKGDRFGDLSYGTYLFGWPITQLLIMAGIRTPLVLAALAVPAALAVAKASWTVVEEPALRLKGWTPGLRPGVLAPAEGSNGGTALGPLASASLVPELATDQELTRI